MSDGLQAALLGLIEACGCWNAFDGPRIAEQLRANSSMWRTAVLVGPTAHIIQEEGTGRIVQSHVDYSAHRGMPDFLYGYDTLELTPAPGNEAALEALASSWGADTLNWIGLPAAASAVETDGPEDYRAAGGDPDRIVLILWWD